MTENNSTHDRDPSARNRSVRCGALSDDITKAVDIISAQNEISGSLGYRLLVQTAENSRMTVRETAGFIVRAAG